MDAINKVIGAMASDIRQMAIEVANLPEINLGNSQLLRNMEVNVREEQDSIIIETVWDDYVEFLEHGRKPRQGKLIPIDALRDWALSKGIASDNSTLFAISRAIWEEGQEARPILAILQERIEERYDSHWEEQLLDSITEKLNQYFN